MSKASHMHIDLTGDDRDNDDSLSELSDLASTPPVAKPLLKSAPPSSSKQPSKTSQVTKSASTSSLAKATSKPKSASKSTADKNANKAAAASGKASRGNILQVDDVVSSRTHVNTGEEGSIVKLCHHHHQSCKGALLECTFMRAPGKRCQKRYCFSVLRRIYDQDPDTIVRSGRMMINPEEHCPSSDAKYAWKCPGCRGKCQCAVCRKAAGLTPLGQWNNIPKGTSLDIDTASTAAKGSQPTQPIKKNKLGDLLEAGSQKSVAAKSKAASQNGVHDAGATPDASTPTGKKKTGTLTLTPVAKPKTPVFKRLIPPTEVSAPSLETIPTKLPEENLRARMWIYESFVRFDKIGLGRSALNQLDRFDSWTHALLQEMLACLLKTIAGLSHIEKGQPTKAFVQSVTAYRQYAKDLQRGEPWSAARQLVHSLGITVTPLAYVEHSVPVEVEMLAAQRSPSPLPLQRTSRARRAKEGNSSRLASQMSMLNNWEENGFDDHDDEDDDEPPRKRTRGNNRKSIYVYDDEGESESDEEVSMEDVDASIRRSSRARKPVVKAATPEVRLTGRQQTLRIQQEQQKETEEQAKREVQSKARERQQARSQRKPSADVSDVSMDEAKDESMAAVDSSTNLKGEAYDQIELDNTEEIAPDMETKVAIIHSLIDASLMAEPLSEELKTAGDNIAVMERTQKVEHAEMEKEIAEELAELNKRAPSIVAPEHQVWKAEKAKLENDVAWRRLDSRVITSLAVDTHSLRTGSLGSDADGREYWHLREYQERMPKFTEGRFAWSLIVLGKPFPGQSAEQTGESAATDPDVSNDSGLTSLDSDIGSSEPVTMVKPHHANGVGSQKHDLGAPETITKDDDRICMGTNDPLLIKTLADFVTYRLQQVEYEENLAMQDREREVRMGKEAGEVGSQPSSPSKQLSPSKVGDDLSAPESMYAIRKAKQQLRDSQEERRTAVQQLVQRLHRSKDYFAWHRMELPPPGPATNP